MSRSGSSKTRLDENEKWFSVSLFIMGDGIDPAALEGMLGLAPDTVGIKGQARAGKNGRTYSPYETNAWTHRVTASSELGFDEQIQLLFHRLGDRKALLRDLCLEDGVDAGLFCGFGSGNGQGGDTIHPNTLRLLAGTGLSIRLDLYPPDADGQEET